jgi:hypothetical protein
MCAFLQDVTPQLATIHHNHPGVVGTCAGCVGTTRSHDLFRSAHPVVQAMGQQRLGNRYTCPHMCSALTLDT